MKCSSRRALAVGIPLCVGLVLGVPGTIGLLVGALTAGFSLAVFLSQFRRGPGTMPKNTLKKVISGGKGSEAHKAAVIGDTVGDPFKDTSGPSLNILIKLMSMVAIVTAGLTLVFDAIVRPTFFITCRLFNCSEHFCIDICKLGVGMAGWFESTVGDCVIPDWRVTTLFRGWCRSGD